MKYRKWQILMLVLAVTTLAAARDIAASLSDRNPARPAQPVNA